MAERDSISVTPFFTIDRICAISAQSLRSDRFDLIGVRSFGNGPQQSWRSKMRAIIGNGPSVPCASRRGTLIRCFAEGGNYNRFNAALRLDLRVQCKALRITASDASGCQPRVMKQRPRPPTSSRNLLTARERALCVLNAAQRKLSKSRIRNALRNSTLNAPGPCPNSPREVELRETPPMPTQRPATEP
jgi:hypothetical protein